MRMTTRSLFAGFVFTVLCLGSSVLVGGGKADESSDDESSSTIARCDRWNPYKQLRSLLPEKEVVFNCPGHDLAKSVAELDKARKKLLKLELCSAAANADVAGVREQLVRVPDLSQLNTRWYGHDPICLAVSAAGHGRQDAYEVLALLLERGGSLNGDRWNNPLGIAVCCGDVCLVRELIRLGADPNSRDWLDGKSPLWNLFPCYGHTSGSSIFYDCSKKKFRDDIVERVKSLAIALLEGGARVDHDGKNHYSSSYELLARVRTCLKSTDICRTVARPLSAKPLQEIERRDLAQVGPHLAAYIDIANAVWRRERRELYELIRCNVARRHRTGRGILPRDLLRYIGGFFGIGLIKEAERKTRKRPRPEETS